MRRAFTLIELMVVCTVLIIISALVAPNVVQMKKAREHQAAYDDVLRLAQMGRNTAISSGHTYVLTIESNSIVLQQGEDSDLPRDGQGTSATSATTDASAPPPPKLPTSGLISGSGTLSNSGGASDAADQSRGSVDLPDGASFSNLELAGKPSSTSEFTLHFYPDGHSEGGGFEMVEGSATRNLFVDQFGLVTMGDGPLPQTGDTSWEAGDYVQRGTN